MSQPTALFRNVSVVNRGTIREADVFIQDGIIAKVNGMIGHGADLEIDGSGKFLLPGIIDTQVHFREPGLTHKASIRSESRAAVMGGVTSFMEMPNTRPPAVTLALLKDKYKLGAAQAMANYSFFMGTTPDNLEEVLRACEEEICGVKIFMGSSTGNMLVDEPEALHRLFSRVPLLISTHCEDEATIKRNEASFFAAYGEEIPVDCHPDIRSVSSCLESSRLAISLAETYGTRLHILHISTSDELALFRSDIPLAEKRITSEVCVHHLHFNRGDYERLGNHIKCNPAIKDSSHQKALLEGLLANRLDIVATDHAPHTLAEKQQPYLSTPSGLPLVQHGLQVMLEFFHAGQISLERIVEKMCHAPAICFGIRNRGFLEEGFAADVALLDLHAPYTVTTENIAYHCGWSPFTGKTFRGQVLTTLINGNPVWHEGKLREDFRGERLRFNR